MSNLEVWGWTALNVWSANTTYNFTNCNLFGVNKFSNDVNNFATISLNDDANGLGAVNGPTVKISGGYLTAVQYSTAMQAAISLDMDCLSSVIFSTYQNGTTAEKVSMQLFGSSADNLPSPFAVNSRADMDAVNELIRKSGFSTNVVATQFILTSETDTASVDTEISNPAAQLTGAEKAVIVHKATGGDHT